MRTDANAYCDANCIAHGHAHTDFNAYSYSYGYGYAHGDTYTDGNAHADSGNTDGDAYVRAWGYTWAVGYRRARATRSLSRWWNDRWNLLLRLRWPNLHRRLP